jgi:predicted house-cleaning NTP pyrophosphatase (Maf/HAM1 superfamily)
MQLIIDENIDDAEWIPVVGEISYEIDNGGRIYLEYTNKGTHTEVGINLSDLLKFIAEQMLVRP